MVTSNNCQRQDKIWDQFEEVLDAVTITENFAKQIADALNETQRKSQSAIRREASGYDEALKALENDEDRVYQDYTRGILDEAGYQRQIKRIRDQRNHFTKLLHKANLMINDAGMETVKSILELATNAKSLWKSRPSHERKELLETLLSNPVLDLPLTVDFLIVI